MRLCNADVDEAERNPSQFEDFDEPEDDEGLRLQGCGKELLKVDRLGSADRGLSKLSVSSFKRTKCSNDFTGNSAAFVTYRVLLCWDVIASLRIQEGSTCQVPQSRSSTSASGH